MEQSQTQNNLDRPIELNEFLALDLPQKESYWGDGLLEPSSISVIGGGSKIGKTIFAFNLGLSLAQGSPFLGFPINSPVKVLIIQQEVRDCSVQKRLKLMLANRKIPSDAFYYKGMGGLKLDTDTGIRQLHGWVKTLRPQVLILDPLYKFHNQNENSAQEMLRIVDALDNLRRMYGLSIVFIHHHRKPQQGEQFGAQQLRGSSVLFDYGDSYITLNYHKKGQDLLRVDFKLRNAESPPSLFIKRNSELWYEVVGGVGQKKIGVGVIVEAVKSLGGRASQKEVTEEVSKKQGVSEATVRRQIQEAIKLRAVIKEQSGKHTQAYLKLPDVKTDVSQMS